MKLPAKPIASPGRSDNKFPPPLMRFLRSNVGSKSRGRLRSSPMFVRKKNTTAVETQEPSSPKVTCMGQVRVRRGSSSSSAASSRPGKGRRAGAPTRKKCGWIQHAVFCSHFPGRIKPKNSCRELWRKWVPFFQAGFCSKAQIEDDPVKMEPRIGEETHGFYSDEEEAEVQEEQEFERKAKAFADSSSSPPKNALLLTRCSSAPYRSSSLACRFWGSPNRAEEEEQSRAGEEKQSKTGEEEQEQSIEIERPESISDQESRSEKRNEEKIEFFKGLGNSIRERMAKSAASIEDLEGGEFGSESARPLILTRCKSEPARTAAEKLDPDYQVFVIN